MIVADYSYYGSIDSVVRQQGNVHNFSQGPGWYQKREGQHYDCCLLIELPRGSQKEAKYSLYIFQNYRIDDVREDWAKTILMPVREL